MGKLWKQNWKIAAGKSPTLADETGEVLTYPTMGLASGDFIGGTGISVDASGTGADAVLVFTNTSTGSASGVSSAGSSTDRAVAIWSGPNGDILQDTGVTISATNVITTSGVINQGLVVNNVTIFPTTPATAVSTDYFCKVTATGVTSFTLPGSPAVGQTHIVKDGAQDANSYAKTVYPAAGTIEGVASIDIPSNGASFNLIYDGTEWSIY